jgi:hypothetical protein
MRWLPDPARATYRRVQPGSFSLSKYRGAWGVLVISGEGLDPDIPAIRVHDRNKGGRLRYVYGKFSRLPVTIPEIVIGVVSGRLRVDRVHDGVIMEGPVETSFLRAYVHMVYAIKEGAEKDSPLYLIAKLLMNSLYGKLIEVREQRRTLLGADGLMVIPRWADLDKSEFREAVRRTYVLDGREGLEALRAEWAEFPLVPGEPPEIFLREVLQSTEYHAGHYFLPLHAAQVTGFVAAKLGLAASVTDALQGDTDSIFTEHPERMEEYYRLMDAAGYPAPREGLGSFTLDIAGVSGVLVKTKMYSLRRPDGKYKQAHHGIIRLLTPKGRESREYLHSLMLTLVMEGKANYATRSRPARLKSVLRGKGVKNPDGTTRKLGIGEFYDEARKIALTQDPNTVPAPGGFLRWKSELELWEEAQKDAERREREAEQRRLRKCAAEFRRAWLRQIGRVCSHDYGREDIPAWVRANARSKSARRLDTLVAGGGGENPLDLLGDLSPGPLTSEADILRVLTAVAP